jgi:hypothetical protein
MPPVPKPVKCSRHIQVAGNQGEESSFANLQFKLSAVRKNLINGKPTITHTIMTRRPYRRIFAFDKEGGVS